MEIIAHRGASGVAPENTLAAIQEAIDFGADSVEIDVRLSRDNEVYLMHDSKVNRTTSGSGHIRHLNSEIIQKLDAGLWYDIKFQGEKVPTLSQVLNLCKGKVKLLIEVKSAERKRYPLLCQKISDLIDEFGAYDWVTVQSFDTKVLHMFNWVNPKLNISKLVVYNVGLTPLKIYFDEKLRRGNLLDVDYLTGINVDYRYATKRLVDNIHAAEKKIFCWTANKTLPMKRLIRIGVDGIITNYPEKLKQILGR